MKKVVNIGIAGRAFVIDEDAYELLCAYLEEFKAKGQMGYQTKEMMDDIESRIAEIFSESLAGGQVVSVALVEQVIGVLGMPDGSSMDGKRKIDTGFVEKKLFRDPDNRVLGGVSVGLGHYFELDPVLIKVIFVISFIFGGLGGWLYVILWLVVPKANTPAEKCQMRGWPVTAENMNKVRQ